MSHLFEQLINCYFIHQFIFRVIVKVGLYRKRYLEDRE